MALDEGYIKFHLNWQKSAPLPSAITHSVVRCRNICFQRKYIGISDGVGYGNISIRHRRTNQFIISGTQTGGLQRLSGKHFTLVTRADFEKNTLICKGPVKASAESLTHAIFYRLDRNINSVLHIHHRAMWSKLKNIVPTTGNDVPYGTVEMCREVERLYQTENLKSKQILVMAGHQDGIISFGKNEEEALKIIDAYALSL